MSGDVLGMTITLGSLLTIIGVVLAIGTFKRNVKKDTVEDREKVSEREARLVSIEKDVQYIRISIDSLVTKVENHEHMLTKHEREIGSLSKNNINKRNNR